MTEHDPDRYICHPPSCASNYENGPDWFSECPAMRETCDCGAVKFYDEVKQQAAELKRLTALLAQANATYVGMEAEIERLRDALISALMLRQH